MKRRTLLQLLLSLAAALPARVRLFAQTPPLTADDEARIRAIADVVLPGEIGAEGRTTATAGFFTWLRDYRAGADTDHGYGFTRLRRTPPSPAAKYPAQLDALDAARPRRRAQLRGAHGERAPRPRRSSDRRREDRTPSRRGRTAATSPRI